MRPAQQRILDSKVGAPAYVRNGRMDSLAANDLGRAPYSPLLDTGKRTPNTARFILLEWDPVESDAVAIPRAAACRDPYDKALTDLTGERSTRSERFRTLWARHDVTLHRSGTKPLHHPLVGDLTLAFQAFELPADPGQQINVSTAEPDSARCPGPRPPRQLDGRPTHASDHDTR